MTVNRATWLIALLTALLLIPFLGAVHLFDWDEINFAECAREMLVSDNYLTLQMNFHPFWEKPPLFIWMQVMSMKAFGVNEFAARFPNALCGILTMVILFRIGVQLAGPRRGWLWVLCFAGSTLPQFYFHSGIIDPWFNLFIFVSFYYFLQYVNPNNEKKLQPLLLAAFCAGLAVLTKGPAALIILFLSVLIFYALRRFRHVMPIKHIFALVGVVTLVGGFWFILLLLTGQYSIIQNFVSYQYHLFHAEDSGHGGPIYYHLVVLLIGCFPASIFAIESLLNKNEGDSAESVFSSGMKVLFWVVLILFSIVQTKIIHYSSLCYFPLTWLAARSIDRWWGKAIKFKKYTNVLLALTGITLSLALTALPFFGKNKQWIIDQGWIKDQMVIENLAANVHWSGWESILGLLLFFSICLFFAFDKKPSKWRVIVLFVTNMFVTQFAGIILAPKIEGYTQYVAIDFYKSLVTKDCYAESLHYLSYAPYFYAQKMPPNMPEKQIRYWMLKGDIDKPCYFVCKVPSSDKVLIDYPELKEIKRANGFVFYQRLPH